MRHRFWPGFWFLATPAIVTTIIWLATGHLRATHFFRHGVIQFWGFLLFYVLMCIGEVVASKFNSKVVTGVCALVPLLVCFQIYFFVDKKIDAYTEVYCSYGEYHVYDDCKKLSEDYETMTKKEAKKLKYKQCRQCRDRHLD